MIVQTLPPVEALTSEQQAIQSLKKGDIRGLEFLVAEHHRRALQVAYLITGDADLAEDVVQDAFLNVYYHIHTFDSSRPFAPWFFTSVGHQAVKAAQKQARYALWDIVDEGETGGILAEFEHQIAPVEEAVTASELNQRVWDALQKLPARQRLAVVQRYFLEMSEGEMAAEFNAPTGTVKWLLNVARKNLRRLLASERKPL